LRRFGESFKEGRPQGAKPHPAGIEKSAVDIEEEKLLHDGG
jgi:hypothetical protein